MVWFSGVQYFAMALHTVLCWFELCTNTNLSCLNLFCSFDCLYLANIASSLHYVAMDLTDTDNDLIQLCAKQHKCVKIKFTFVFFTKCHSMMVNFFS